MKTKTAMPPTAAELEAVVPSAGDKLTLQQLESHLWGAANILRGSIDSADFKHYIFGLLFFKRLCDVWEEEYEARMAEFNVVYVFCEIKRKTACS